MLDMSFSNKRRNIKPPILKDLKKFNKENIVLASGSPRRKKILKDAGLKFRILKSNVNEEKIKNIYRKSNFFKLVKILSLSKALSVIKDNSISGLVVGFDTIVVCDGKIIDKPKNKKDAIKKLLFLSNKIHKVYSGISIINSKDKNTLLKNNDLYMDLLNSYKSSLVKHNYEVTKISMKKISLKEATKYVSSGEPLDKAGAYAIQGKGREFINTISGDYYNVVGLPLDKFYLMLDSQI